MLLARLCVARVGFECWRAPRLIECYALVSRRECAQRERAAACDKHASGADFHVAFNRSPLCEVAGRLIAGLGIRAPAGGALSSACRLNVAA